MQITQCYWKIGENEGSWQQNKSDQIVPLLPAMMRRRLTPFGKMALGSLYKSLSCVNEEKNPRDIQWVVSCRHGDTYRMVQLLSKLEQGELLSPTDFSLSVHNAIIGLFSIEMKNKKMHTALSGAQATFEMGLLEAFALHQESQKSVGYFYYDQPLPEMYRDKVQDDSCEVSILMILDAEDNSGQQSKNKVLKFTYTNEQDNKASHGFQTIISLVGFLNNDDKNYKISFSGGAFILERSGSEI
jgi:hypothetical protein